MTPEKEDGGGIQLKEMKRRNEEKNDRARAAHLILNQRDHPVMRV